MRSAWRDERLAGISPDGVSADSLWPAVGQASGHTYTMVFSRRARQVRQSSTLSHPITPADLIAERGPLEAEEQSARGESPREWGCVALLCNPDAKTPEELLKAWADASNVNGVTEM